MANALVNSAPLVIDVTDPSERRKMAGYVFKVSRALIGNTLANQLNYPPDGQVPRCGVTVGHPVDVGYAAVDRVSETSGSAWSVVGAAGVK